jgi:hypothetical protein
MTSHCTYQHGSERKSRYSACENGGKEGLDVASQSQLSCGERGRRGQSRTIIVRVLLGCDQSGDWSVLGRKKRNWIPGGAFGNFLPSEEETGVNISLLHSHTCPYVVHPILGGMRRYLCYGCKAAEAIWRTRIKIPLHRLGREKYMSKSGPLFRRLVSRHLDAPPRYPRLPRNPRQIPSINRRRVRQGLCILNPRSDVGVCQRIAGLVVIDIEGHSSFTSPAAINNKLAPANMIWCGLLTEKPAPRFLSLRHR